MAWKVKVRSGTRKRGVYFLKENLGHYFGMRDVPSDTYLTKLFGQTMTELFGHSILNCTFMNHDLKLKKWGLPYINNRYIILFYEIYHILIIYPTVQCRYNLWHFIASLSEQ